MKTKLTIVSLLLIITITSVAQEKLTPEEMFRWFPEGKYEGITYKDNVAAQTMPGLKILAAINYQHQHWDADLLIPGTLKQHWLSLVQMHSVKVVVSKKSDNVDMGRGGRMMRAIVGEEIYNANSFGYRMQVIRFSPDLELKKLALSQKGVSFTKESVGEFPIYFAKLDKPTRLAGDFYFCITPENELLSCSEKKLLLKMVKAGTGDFPCIVDDFPFPYVFEILPGLKHHWTLSDWSVLLNALIKKLEKDEVDTSEIEKMKQRRDNSTPSITDYNFAALPTKRTLAIHSSSENAESACKARKEFMKERDPRMRMPESSWLLQESSTLSHQGNLMITTLLYSNSYLKEYNRLREEEDKAWKAEQAKKAAKEKGASEKKEK